MSMWRHSFHCVHISEHMLCLSQYSSFCWGVLFQYDNNNNGDDDDDDDNHNFYQFMHSNYAQRRVGKQNLDG